MIYIELRQVLLALVLGLGASLGHAAESLPAKASNIISPDSIPRLPSLDPLREIVRAGAPTERLRDLPQHDPSSACEIILEGDFGSVRFPNVLSAFSKAQLSSKNLTLEERNFLLAAVSLHVAIKLQQGSFGDLDGSPEVLDFLGVESFRFSEEYLNVLRFWLTRLPKGIELWSSVQIDTSIGEVYYGGANIQERFVELDPRKREQRQKDLILEDYRRGIVKSTGLPIDLLTTDAMQDFLSIREVLGALTNRVRRPNQSSANMEFQNLGHLITAIKQIRAD